ncbi:MAG: FHA domain-containing protein [Hyphomicrobiaceae bacterium]|nr:FHA domain-containing protein [Hyphomicrobiaceae bacterium]
MSNGRDDNPNAKRTVILNESGGSNSPTRIIDQGQLPGHGSGLPPTEVFGGNKGTPGLAPTQTSRTDRNTPYPPTQPTPDGQPLPGATRMILPDSFGGGDKASGGAARQQQSGFDSLHHVGQPPSGQPPAAARAEDEAPVVGWLVVIAGPGRGKSRPIYWGNNSIGRDLNQHIALDFGDMAISGTEQAYLRYNPRDRSFTLVPNLAKSNFVTVNDDTPMVPTVLQPLDRIGMGITTLCFVPFCGAQFDWSDA